MVHRSTGTDLDVLSSAFRDLKLDENLIKDLLAPIARAPETEEPWVEAAAKLHRSRYPRAAARVYEVALQRFPRSARLWGHRGVLERNRGNHDEAVQFLKQALALKPDYGIAIHNLANAYELHGDFALAFEWYGKAIESDGTRAPSWNGLGNCHGALAQYEQAIDCYRRAIDLDPNYNEPYFNWAVQPLAPGGLPSGDRPLPAPWRSLKGARRHIILAASSPRAATRRTLAGRFASREASCLRSPPGKQKARSAAGCSRDPKCPQLVEGDVRAFGRDSGFDPITGPCGR
jgi:tetratricopeptide (TPR) repeat protein